MVIEMIFYWHEINQWGTEGMVLWLKTFSVLVKDLVWF